MSDPNRCASNCDDVAVRDVAVSLFEVDPVVVGQFAFHHDIAMDAVAKPSADSKIVGIGLHNIYVINEHASFDAFLCERPRTASVQQKSYNDESKLGHAGRARLWASGMRACFSPVATFVSRPIELPPNGRQSSAHECCKSRFHSSFDFRRMLPM